MSTLKRAIAYVQRESPREIIDNERKKVWNLIPFNLRLKYRLWKHRQNHPRGAIAHPLKLITVDPTNVQSGERFSRTRNVGEIIGGDWDLSRGDPTENQIYRGLYSRFVENNSWEDTEYWEFAVEQLEEKGQVFGYNSLEKFREHRLPYVDDLYQSIISNGYQTQDELDPADRDKKRHRRYPTRHRVTHEVGVNIARDGTLVLNSGIHRLSIARIADLDEIPVLVIVRHEKWQEKRNQRFIANEKCESDHPDLQDLC